MTRTARVFGPATSPVEPVITTDEVASLGIATTVTESVPGSRKMRPPFLTDWLFTEKVAKATSVGRLRTLTLKE